MSLPHRSWTCGKRLCEPLNGVAAVHQKVAYKLEANHFSAVMGCLLLLSAALSRHSIHLWPIRDGKMSLLPSFRASVSRKKNNEGWTGELSVPPVKRRCKVPRTTLPLAPVATPHPAPHPSQKGLGHPLCTPPWASGKRWGGHWGTWGLRNLGKGSQEEALEWIRGFTSETSTGNSPGSRLQPLWGLRFSNRKGSMV